MANQLDNMGEVFVNKVLLCVGAVTGFYGLTLQDIDLLMGILLKSVSILSFTIVIVINMPKFIDVLKNWIVKDGNKGSKGDKN